MYTNDDSLLGFTFYRGRVALHAILKAIGVSEGNEVIIQAFTCVAVPEAIMAIGAHPVYADIETASFNMDPISLVQKISYKTRAIIVQHTFGIPNRMEEICQIASKVGIPVIEDCCHTLVSTYKGRTVGTFGVASFYSFEWGKPIVIGIGGSAIVNDHKLQDKLSALYSEYRTTNFVNLARIQLQYCIFSLLHRPVLYERMRLLFNWLALRGIAHGNYNRVGKDYKVAEDFTLKMSIPLVRRLARKLRSLDVQSAYRRWVSSEYFNKIRSAAVSHPVFSDENDVVFVRYPIIARNKSALLIQARRNKVELADWYLSPVHPISSEHYHLVEYKINSCPNAEQRCREVVTLPTHRGVSGRDICRAVEFLNSVA